MRIRRTHSNHFVHGHSRIGHITPEFTAYFNAKKRCTRRCGKDFKESGNVRWTTRSESSKNQRMTIKRLRAMRNNMRKSQKFRWLKQ
jgi:hypothetical protein